MRNAYEKLNISKSKMQYLKSKTFNCKYTQILIKEDMTFVLFIHLSFSKTTSGYPSMVSSNNHRDVLARTQSHEEGKDRAIE